MTHDVELRDTELRHQEGEETREVLSGEVDVTDRIDCEVVGKHGRLTHERPEAVLVAHDTATVHCWRGVDLVAGTEQVLAQRSVGVARGETLSARFGRRRERTHGVATRDDDDSASRGRTT